MDPLPALALCAALTATASAQDYEWASWFRLNPRMATTSGDFGFISTSISSIDPEISLSTPWPIHFDNEPFTPVDAPSVAMQNPATNRWSFFVNFNLVPNTLGLVVGLGNFGHGDGFPGYKLEVFNVAGQLMPLSWLDIIGSYDHTWTDTGDSFNDDLALNTTTGDFLTTTVPGLSDDSSDMLLFTLPRDVQTLRIFVTSPSAADTVNLVIGTPAPGAAAMFGLAGLAAARRRRA